MDLLETQQIVAAIGADIAAAVDLDRGPWTYRIAYTSDNTSEEFLLDATGSDVGAAILPMSAGSEADRLREGMRDSEGNSWRVGLFTVARDGGMSVDYEYGPFPTPVEREAELEARWNGAS